SRHPPGPPLFPYTTLFRSARKRGLRGGGSMTELVALPTQRDEEWRYADFAAVGTLAPEAFGQWKEIALAPGETRGKCLILSGSRSEEHTSELQSRENLVCR